MTEVEVAATGLVVTVKVVDVLPPGTVTLAGTVATDVLLLERITIAPPAGAAPLRVTVPIEELPPITLDGLSVTDDAVTGAGVTARLVVSVVP